LRQMDILPIDLPFRCIRIDADFEPCRQTRSILEQDKRGRLFAYATMDDKYAMCFDDEEEDVDAFLKCEDREAYDGLMQIVEENQPTSVSGSLP
jgi:hypothetical protein